MSVITFEGKSYTCNAGESVLECLTRHGVLIPSSCQSGACQTCLIRAVHGTPTAESQKGIKDTLAAQNYFLACVCRSEEDLEIALADVVDAPLSVTVVEKTQLNASVVRLRLQSDKPLDYIAGQFVNVSPPDQRVTRSYSLASLPDEEALELHVRRVPDGRMSSWLCDQVEVGEQLLLTGAAGDCFYTEKDLDQPLLMVATGTGLAPLYGILRDALRRGHRGLIHLFHASLAVEGLYYMNELQHLAAVHEQLRYVPCVLHGEPPVGGLQGDIQQLIRKEMVDLKGWRVYVCGDPAIVQSIKQVCFMAGASMSEIYSDPFVFEAS